MVINTLHKTKNNRFAVKMDDVYMIYIPIFCYWHQN